MHERLTLFAETAETAPEQPPLLDPGRREVSVAIGTLALGGAERIALDWAARCAARYRVRIVVLRAAPSEWPVPRGVELTRLRTSDPERELAAIGAAIASGGNPVVLCHMLAAAERNALARGGACPVPVLHNSAAGWQEGPEALRDAPFVLAVSRAAARELRGSGFRAPVPVIHHVPRTPVARPGARCEWRARWALPERALVIGMTGAVKPQKAYPRALRMFAGLLERCDAYLVIVGGPVGADGPLAWDAMVAQTIRLGLRERVRVPGFLAGAADCMAAFDVFLNTSRYEGLSIATLEALAAGLPVVASNVGGQNEMPAPGLTLMPVDSPVADWVAALEAALWCRPLPPAWRDVATPRLWTLFHLLRPFEPLPGVLFVTANLNAGGAQRSLVHLATALNGSLRIEIAVCGDSSTDYFSRRLEGAKVQAYCSAGTRDCFDHAEAITARIVDGRFATVCFWNVDAKVKLLLAKALGVARVRLIDVSPGGYGFEEMTATRSFQQWIAFTEEEYYAGLARLVLKYDGDAPPAFRGRVSVIPNGVPVAASVACARAGSTPRIVMSGRIAPSKFVREAMAAMPLLWASHHDAELHVLGPAEKRHSAYLRQLIDTAGTELGRRIFLQGAAFDAPERMAEFSVALVLGEHQGCPNAVLEALACGVPVVANDSGGTRALVVDGATGLLLRECEPRAIAAALARLLDDPRLAGRLGTRGQRHVARHFSMTRMVRAYEALFTNL